MTDARHEFTRDLTLQLTPSCTLKLVAQEQFLQGNVVFQFQQFDDAFEFAKWANTKYNKFNFTAALEQSLARCADLSKPSLEMNRTGYEIIMDKLRPQDIARETYDKVLIDQKGEHLRVRLFGSKAHFYMTNVPGALILKEIRLYDTYVNAFQDMDYLTNILVKNANLKLPMPDILQLNNSRALVFQDKDAVLKFFVPLAQKGSHFLLDLFEQAHSVLTRRGLGSRQSSFANPFVMLDNIHYTEPKPAASSDHKMMELMKSSAGMQPPLESKSRLSEEEELALVIKLSQDLHDAKTNKERSSEPVPVTIKKPVPDKEEKHAEFKHLPDDSLPSAMQARLRNINNLLQEAARRTANDPGNRIHDEALKRLPDASLKATIDGNVRRWK